MPFREIARRAASVAYPRHQTQLAAQFAVASELCKRGYEVLFILRHNTPLADLMAISPQAHTQFLIDVEGLAQKELLADRPQQREPVVGNW